MTAPAAPAGVRPLRGNAPLALDAAGPAWRVTAGRAQLFAVLAASASADGDGSPVPRVPLFALEAGEWAFPAPGQHGDGASVVELLLVALEDGTEIEAVGRPWAAGQYVAERDGKPPVAAAELRHAVETWAERLAAAVADPHHPAGEALPVQGPAQVEAGAAAWPTGRTAWLAVETAAPVLLLGGPALAPPPGVTAIVPLPASAWVLATTAATLEVVPAAAALERDLWWHGLQTFAAAALARARALAAEREADSARAIEQRMASEAQTREWMYSCLAEVADGGTVAELDISRHLPPAMALVAQAAAIELHAPGRPLAASENQVEAVAQASGVRWRHVTLRGCWWRQDIGPLLSRMAGTDALVALLPARPGRVDVVDPAAGTRRRVDAAVAATISPDAVVLYRPLPARKVSGGDILRFAARAARGDLLRLGLLALAVGAMSIVTPLVTKAVFSTIVPERELGMLAWLVGLLGMLGLATFVFTAVQQLAIARIGAAVTSGLQPAIWDRVLNLPLGFFRQYSAGALANRVMAIDKIQQLATTIVAAALLAVPVGLFNLGLAFWLNARLALFGTGVLVIVVAGMIVMARAQMRHVAAMTHATQESFGVAMQLVDGVGKLRVANAEDRAFAQWGERFAATKTAFISSQRGFAAVTAFGASWAALGIAAMLLGAATLPKGALSAATFIAFNTAFSQALAATTGFIGVAIFVVQSRPLYDSARPALESIPEVTTVKADPGQLSGAIEIAHVTFRYAPDDRPVLSDVSFSVEPGEFVAIVGPSGAGKSSLIRILLGFEQPEVGSVRYDGKDLDGLDVRSVRRQIGVVTQSVRLLPGDIFTNIVGTRPLSMDDAWAAAEIAGIAEDIRAMPMQMQTFVAEGASTFAGGQRQRLLIARAVAGKPRILLFDEATSALDNRTQAQVAEAIAGLRAARIVIAHRLSTVRNADKILVLQAGQIVESGSYEELAGAGGLFATLAQRQIV